MGDNSQTWYRNTPANRLMLGYDHVPEHCIGDRLAPWVLHDTGLGRYVFANQPLDFVQAVRSAEADNMIRANRCPDTGALNTTNLSDDELRFIFSNKSGKA